MSYQSICHESIKSIIYELCIKTTEKLNKSQDELKKIKWNDGESNLDTEYSKLACKCCELAWDEIKEKNPKYSKIKIICEIPDINITFIYSDQKELKDKIELKSSTRNKIPGSTIGKLDINQMLIYCLRPNENNNSYIFKCGQYHDAMEKSEIDLFQDRTPRPHLNFDRLTNVSGIQDYVVKNKNYWIDHYVKCAINRIKPNTKCKHSWQDDMLKELKKKIINNYIKNISLEEFQIHKIILEDDPNASI